MEVLFTLFEPGYDVESIQFEVPFCDGGGAPCGQTVRVQTYNPDHYSPEYSPNGTAGNPDAADLDVCMPEETTPCTGVTLSAVCDTDPADGTSHVVTVDVAFAPPAASECAYRVQVYTVTGSGGSIYADNIPVAPSGLVEFSQTLDYYDNVGTDIACFRVKIDYSPACAAELICEQTICLDLRELECEEDVDQGGPYVFVYDCVDKTPTHSVYDYDLSFPEFKGSPKEVELTGIYGNVDKLKISENGHFTGRLRVPVTLPVFKANLTVEGVKGKQVFYVEELLRECPNPNYQPDNFYPDGGSDDGTAALRVFPNPTRQQVTAVYRLREERPGAQLLLTNLLGEHVGSWQLDGTADRVTLDLGRYGDGVYFVQLYDGSSRVAVQRLVIQR